MDDKLHIGYVRVSTEEQAHNGFSIDFQRERIKNKFESMGINEYLILVDDGISGKSFNRPKIKRVINWVKENKIETFIVYKLDRLSRNLTDLISLLEEMTSKKTNFISIAEDLNMSNAAGRMFIYIIGIFAQFEREQISERTLTGMYQKASQGQYPYARRPFGYDKLEDHTLKINDKEKGILLEIFDLYVIQYKSVDYVREYSKKKGIHFRHPLERLTKTIYQGYITIPKGSDNRFDICEPIFSSEDVKKMEIRHKHNQRHYGFKHDYKFRNKIIIDGQNAKHQKQKKKSGKVYNYYYVDGGTYINENDIIDLINLKAKEEYEQQVGKIEKLIKDLAYDLSIGSITKEEFDYKYKRIMEKNEIKKFQFKHIFVTTKKRGKHKELEYIIE